VSDNDFDHSLLFGWIRSLIYTFEIFIFINSEP